MGTTETVITSTETKGKRPKNEEWKAKSAAPGDWVSTLLRVEHVEGTTVMIEFRAGRKGAPMLVDAIPYQGFMDEGAYLSVAPMASECWGRALEHRSDLEAERYDYRIRAIQTDDDGHTTIHESAWVEAPNETGDVLSIDSRNHDPMTQMLANMVTKLFSVNIGMARANAYTMRQYNEGTAAGVQSQFAAVGKVQQMAQELIDAKTEMAKEAGDAQEVQEMGKTARKWIGMSHEAKLAKQGVRTPNLPATRREAAISLYNSLTVKQLSVLNKELGADKAEMLVGLMEGAQKLSDEQVEQVFAEHFGGKMSDDLELLNVAEKVFSADYVPATWAIWQSQCANILINGIDDEAD